MAENTPDIRFGSFAEDWKRSKIGDVITEKKRPVVLDDNTTYQLITVKRRNEGVISRGFLKGRQILVKNYFELKPKDYVISKRQVVHGANGIVPEKLDGAIVSNEYLVAIANDDITTEFLTLISKLPDMYKKFFVSSYGIDIEKLVFDVDDWKKRELSIPDTAEQKKINAFFNVFDKQHAAEQHKYDKLISFKKSMLDKMFPKDGAKVPEVRFDGFNGEWEKKKLWEMCEYYTSNLSVSDATSEGDFELYDASSVIGYTNKNIQQVDYITIIKDGSGVGRVRKLYAKTSFISTMGAFHASKNTDIDFLLCILINLNLTKYITGANIPHVYFRDYKHEELLFPNIEEQEKIGSFFKNLDTQVTLQKEKLQKLTNIKKAFLKKMFL